MTPRVGNRKVDCAAAEVQKVARQIGCLLLPGPVSAADRPPRKHKAVADAQAAAAAAETAAKATMASQALLVAVRDQGPKTPKKTKVHKEPTSAEKHVVASHDAQGSAFPAEKVQEKENASPAIASPRPYAKRGSAGTFQGKRPPKHPEKLKAFMAAKAKYEAEKAEMKKSQRQVHRRPSPTQEEYRAWQKAFSRSKAASSREHFIEAAAEWRKEKAKTVKEKHNL